MKFQSREEAELWSRVYAACRADGAWLRGEAASEADEAVERFRDRMPDEDLR